MDFPLFQKISKGIFTVRFRSDEMTYVQHWALPSISYLQKKFLKNEKYMTRLLLERNQILLVDNTRMLHGREGFETTSENLRRHLRRAWIADDNRTLLMNIADQQYQHRVFKSYEKYGLGPPSERVRKWNSPRLGIKLDDELRLAIENSPLIE